MCDSGVGTGIETEHTHRPGSILSRDGEGHCKWRRKITPYDTGFTRKQNKTKKGAGSLFFQTKMTRDDIETNRTITDPYTIERKQKLLLSRNS